MTLADRIRATMKSPYTGMCYAASEAYYHLAGGKAAGLTPVYMPEPAGHGDGSEKHWALRTADGAIIDLTVEQYGGDLPDYSLAKGCGFLTREPSAAARALLECV